MKQFSNFIIGAIMLVIGGSMFLSNITVSSGGTGFLGGILSMLCGTTGTEPQHVTGILLVLIFTMLIIAFIKPNVFTIGGLILSCLVFVFSVIGGMEITLADMSGLELTVMIGLMLSGLGLAIRAISTSQKESANSIDGFEL